MYYWITFLIAWSCLLLLMANGVKLPKKQQTSENIDKYMNNHPHVTDEGALVDALKDENIQYRGVQR